MMSPPTGAGLRGLGEGEGVASGPGINGDTKARHPGAVTDPGQVAAPSSHWPGWVCCPCWGPRGPARTPTSIQEVRGSERVGSDGMGLRSGTCKQ